MKESEQDIPRNDNGRVRWASLDYSTEATIELIKSEAKSFLESESKVTQALLVSKGRSDLAVVASRKYPGGLHQLRLDIGETDIPKPSGYWQVKDNILNEARSFLESHGKLSSIVTGKLNPSLNYAVVKYYQGGWVQLRKDLNLDVPRKGGEYWTTDVIEKEAEAVLKETGELTVRILQSTGRNDLLIAITRKYPGKIRALQEKFGVKPVIKRGYWTREKIFEQAKQFIGENGSINAPKLHIMGRSDLAGAIASHYSGKMFGLKRDLGLEVKPRDKGVTGLTTEQRQEFIEAKAREIIDLGVEFRRSKIEDAGFRNFLHLVQRYYKGGLAALKEKFGLSQELSSEQAVDYIKGLFES